LFNTAEKNGLEIAILAGGPLLLIAGLLKETARMPTTIQGKQWQLSPPILTEDSQGD